MSFLFCVSEEVQTHLWVKDIFFTVTCGISVGLALFSNTIASIATTILWVLLTGESLALSSSIIYMI
jgi:hypothetical protein